MRKPKALKKFTVFILGKEKAPVTLRDQNLSALLELIGTGALLTSFCLWGLVQKMESESRRIKPTVFHYMMFASVISIQFVKLIVYIIAVKKRSFLYLYCAPRLLLIQGCLGYPIGFYNRWVRYIRNRVPIMPDIFGLFWFFFSLAFLLWLIITGFKRTKYLKQSQVKLGSIYDRINIIKDFAVEELAEFNPHRLRSPSSVSIVGVGQNRPHSCNHYVNTGRMSIKSASNGKNSSKEARRWEKKFFQEMKDMLIETTEVDIHDEKIGHGQFGHVFKGTLREQKVKRTIAAKIFNDNEPDGIVQEMKIIVLVGQHEHIVKFDGVTVNRHDERNFALIFEYCGLGTLESCLRRMKTANPALIEENIFPASIYVNVEQTDGTAKAVLNSHLRRFAHEICSGMAYIAKKRVVHGDLAARNVLLTTNLGVKISDFGMSKRLYAYEVYSKANQESLLPWRWMSVEALEELKLSEKSDVWSFGITLWEIFSLGTFPYKDFEWSANFLKMLRNGLRMTDTGLINSEMYGLMESCWRINPEARPNFSEILEYLKLKFCK